MQQIRPEGIVLAILRYIPHFILKLSLQHFNIAGNSLD